MVKIYPEMDNYNYKILKDPLVSMAKCGINSVFNHQYLGKVVSRELSHTELDALVDDESQLAPIQPNSAYFICKFESQQKANAYVTTSPIAKLLCTDNGTPEGVVHVPFVASPISTLDIPWMNMVHHDLKFISQTTEALIGWYNKPLNILWMTDICGDEKTAKNNLKEVLSIIQRFNLTGTLPLVKITIGADPEFEVVDKNGELVSAKHVFPDNGLSDPIGHDGNADTGEIRPKFAYSPLKLSRNIKRLVRKIQRNPTIASGLAMYSGGGTKVATGGHIHFGPYKSWNEELKKAIWKLVAEPVLAHQGELRRSVMTDKCTETGSDVVRQQPHGTEWRPLPSFIVNEETTQAVLCTSYAIVKSYFNGGIPKVLDSSAYKRLKFYTPYKKYIDMFVDLFINDKSTKLEKRDVLKEWRLNKLKERNATIIVESPSDWLRSFFTPLYVPLAKPMRIYLAFNNANTIAAFGFNTASKKALTEFSNNHFVQLESRFTTVDALVKNCIGRKFPISPDIVLLLPNVWAQSVNNQRLFHEIKDLLKSAITELNSFRI